MKISTLYKVAIATVCILLCSIVWAQVHTDPALIRAKRVFSGENQNEGNLSGKAINLDGSGALVLSGYYCLDPAVLEPHPDMAYLAKACQ